MESAGAAEELEGEAPAAAEDPKEAVEAEAAPATWVQKGVRAIREVPRGLRAILRVRPYDTSTEEGRSMERYRRAALSSATAMLSHGLAIGTGLLNVRITLGYLGKSRYGLWMAIGSLITWAALADFGLARGMQNHLSEAHGKDDRDAAARYVSTGFLTLTTIAFVLAIAMTPLLWAIPWTRVLNVDDPSLVGETRWAVAAVAVCFLAQFPLSIVPTIYSAYQRAYVANLFSIVGSVVSLGALVVVTQLRLSLPWLILASGGTTTLMTGVNLFWILREMPWLRPRRALASKSTLRALAGTSTALLLFQLGSLIINETQIVIVAQRIGLSTVTDWSIFMRVHVLPIIFIQMLDGPLIPAFREAHVRGESKWLRTAFWRITKIKMVIAVGAIAFYFLAGNIAVKLLTGSAVEFSPRIWGASGFLLVVGVWNGSFNDLLIAVDRLWVLVIAIIFNGLVTCSLTFLMAKPLGMFGVVLATPIYSLVVTAWLLPWLCRDILFRRKEPPAIAPAGDAAA